MKKIILTISLSLLSTIAFAKQTAIYNQSLISEDSFGNQISFMDHERCQYLGVIIEDKNVNSEDNTRLMFLPNSKKIEINFSYKRCGEVVEKYENTLKIGYLGNGPIKTGEKFYISDEK